MGGWTDRWTYLSTELWKCKTSGVISGDSDEDGIGVGGSSDGGGNIFPGG